ncbi:MAG: ribosome small subunit-dependent GTPase A [Eubacteriales bacterium]
MILLEDYGFFETMLYSLDMTQYDASVIPARVTAVHKDRYELICEYGTIFGRLKSSVYYTDGRESFPTTGDFVLISLNQSGDSIIIRTLPRKSMFVRSDFSGHAAGFVKTVLQQTIAANFDYVFILTSLNRDFNVSRVMRYLTMARQSGAQPVVILTKADLQSDSNQYVADIRKAAPHVPVHAVSSHTGFGLDELESYLQPRKTIVFLGMSGVGKSSLLNALMKQEVMAVSSIREGDSRGRHTTTHRQLFMLPSGAMVIDTPGMRELGLFHADEGISTEFSDVEELFTECRFTDCRHKTEPGCAVLAALNDGALSRERWEYYLAQKQENRFVDDKTGYLKEKKARHKSISKWSKQMKKGSFFDEYSS